MHTISNYRCGPGAALPKSRSNNVRGRSCMQGKRKTHNKSAAAFFGERLSIGLWRSAVY